MEDNERTQVRAVRRGVQPQESAAAEQPAREAARENDRETSRSVDGAIARGRMLLDELEAIFRDARQLPVLKTRMVPESAFEDLIGQLRITMPDMVREAERVLGQKEDILTAAREDAKEKREAADRYDREHREAADSFDRQTRADAESYRGQVLSRAQEDATALIQDAETRARQIVEAANAQAAAMVEDHEITRRAEAYALELRDNAARQAANMVDQARHQTDLILSGAAAALSRNASEMAKLRDSLLSGDKGQQA